MDVRVKPGNDRKRETMTEKGKGNDGEENEFCDDRKRERQ